MNFYGCMFLLVVFVGLLVTVLEKRMRYELKRTILTILSYIVSLLGVITFLSFLELWE